MRLEIFQLEMKNSKGNGKQANLIRGCGASASQGLPWLCDSCTLFLHEKTTDDQRVHAGAEKGADRIRRRVYNSLAA
jgi:hypothetical protein